MRTIVTDDSAMMGHFWPYVGLAEYLGDCAFYQPTDWQWAYLIARGILTTDEIVDPIVCAFGAHRIWWRGPYYLPFIPGEDSAEGRGTCILADADFAGYAAKNQEFVGFHPRKPSDTDLAGHAYVYGVDVAVDRLPVFVADGSRDCSGELASASVCVCHGGLGTVSEAISYGVPLIVVSRDYRDQRQNGERVEALGVGVHIKAEDFDGAITERMIEEARGKI